MPEVCVDTYISSCCIIVIVLYVKKVLSLILLFDGFMISVPCHVYRVIFYSFVHIYLCKQVEQARRIETHPINQVWIISYVLKFLIYFVTT